MNDPHDKDAGKSSEENPNSGFSFMDMLDLSPQMHSIMRLLIPAMGMSYLRLCEGLDALPEGERLSQTEIDETLRQMVERGIIAKEMVDGQVVYKVLVGRRKARTNTLDKEIWDALGWDDNS